MTVRYISANEAAEKWGLSVRSVQNLCKNGKIYGARRFGNSWSIPEDSSRPADGRKKDRDRLTHWDQPLIKKTPFLDMTDLYNKPGSADRVVESLSTHSEAQALFAAEIAYARGEIDKVYEYSQAILESRSGFYAVLAGGTLLAQCALWKGDISMWRRARKHLYDAPCKNDIDRDIVLLSTAVTDCSIRDTRDFPEWFLRGCFDNLHADSFPAARVYYVKSLMITTQVLAASNVEYMGLKGVELMRTHPFIIELVTSQAVMEKTVMAEIYIRLFATVCYNLIGERERAIKHLDRAIDLCIADRLYGILAENRRSIGTLLDERIAVIAPQIDKRVKELYKIYNSGWTKVHNIIMERRVFEKLSTREREVARLAAFGLSNQQIAAQLYLSEASVKSIIQIAKNKTGAATRGELGSYI